MREYWIAPSDLNYLWKDSIVGFYDKYVLNIKRPFQPFPAIYSFMDSEMKKSFEGKNLSHFIPNAPDGIIAHKIEKVQSKLININGLKIGYRGKIDSLIQLQDETYIVCDYKCIKNLADIDEIYFLTMMSYALSLQNPLVGDPLNISGIGLLVFNPYSFEFNKQNASFNGNLQWVDLSFDKERFKRWMIQDLVPLLQGTREELPVSELDKSWAKYLDSFFLEETEDL